MIGLCINNREPELSVLDIVEGTSVDGVGLRTSIYFAGCENACEGCHNPQSWNMANGKKYSVDTLYDIVREVDMNVTFSGGDPMLQAGALCVLGKTYQGRVWKDDMVLYRVSVRESAYPS